MTSVNVFEPMNDALPKITIKSAIFDIGLYQYDGNRTWKFQPDGTVIYYMERCNSRKHLDQQKHEFSPELYWNMIKDLEKCLRNLDRSLYTMTLDDTAVNITIQYPDGLKIEAPAYMGSADGTLFEIVKKYYPELDL